MNKRVTSLVLAGALGLGGAATGLVLAPAVASAATGEQSAADALGDRVSRITQALAGLVSDGSITQQQADEVATSLAERLPVHGHGHGHGGPGGPGGGLGLETAAEVLGTTTGELRAALEGGQSLADVAADRGVDTRTLVDELVAAASERLDEKVAAGRATQAEADDRKAELTERVTAQVEREGLPARGERMPRPSTGEQAPAEESSDQA